MQKNRHNFYLLIHNIAKPKNVGTIIRTAAAFDVKKVFLLSKDPEKKKKSKAFKSFGLKFGAHGTEKKVDYHFFYNVDEAVKYFKENNICICGIEIGEKAKSVAEQPFDRDTVFIPGNEGDGKTGSVLIRIAPEVKVCL